MFRNFHNLDELREAVILDSHSFVLMNHSGIVLPVEQVPRNPLCNYSYTSERTKADKSNEQRISETIAQFINRSLKT